MRRTWLISAAATFTACFVVLARGQLAEAIYRLIIEGFYAAIWLLSAAGFGVAILRALKVPAQSKALAFATAAATGFGLIGFIVLGLGLVGALNRPVAIGIVLAGLIAGGTSIKKIQFGDSIPLLLFMPTLALVLVGAFTLPGILWSDEPAGYDVMEYHLQVPREWYEAGKIIPLKHNVFSYFPFNVEMHYLLAMHLRGGAYEGMYLVQLMHAVLVGLSVLAVTGVAAPASRIAPIVLGSIPWLMMLAPVAYNEGGLLLFGTLAIVWALGAGPSNLALAGAMAGLACGSKLTAVPVLLIGIPLAGIAAKRLSLKSCAVFIVTGVATLSPWLIRNQLWAGNPVFPEAAKILGHAHFTEAQVQRWSDAHHPQIVASGRFHATMQQVLVDWRWGFLVLPLSVIAIALGWRRSEVKFLAGLLLVQVAFWFGFTHLQGRFIILAAPIAAMLIAQVDLPRWRVVALSSAGVSAVVGWVMLASQLLQLPASLGVEDFAQVLKQTPSILPPEIATQAFDEKRPIVLVGEARAFMFPIPMSRLHYRTVFDIVDWIDPSAPPDALIVASPREMIRLAKTYTHLPPLSPGVESHTDPFILQKK